MEKAREYARNIASYSPTAIRFLKHSLNADADHLAGIGNVAFAGALDLFVHFDEGMERGPSPRSDGRTSSPIGDGAPRATSQLPSFSASQETLHTWRASRCRVASLVSCRRSLVMSRALSDWIGWT